MGPSPVAHRIQGFGSEPHPSTQPYQGVGQGAGAPYHMSHDGTGIGSGVGGGLSSSLSGSGGGLSSSITVRTRHACIPPTKTDPSIFLYTY